MMYRDFKIGSIEEGRFYIHVEHYIGNGYLHRDLGIYDNCGSENFYKDEFECKMMIDLYYMAGNEFFSMDEFSL